MDPFVLELTSDCCMLEVARLPAGLEGEDIFKTLGLQLPLSLKTR